MSDDRVSMTFNAKRAAGDLGEVCLSTGSPAETTRKVQVWIETPRAPMDPRDPAAFRPGMRKQLLQRQRPRNYVFATRLPCTVSIARQHRVAAWLGWGAAALAILMLLIGTLLDALIVGGVLGGLAWLQARRDPVKLDVDIIHETATIKGIHQDAVNGLIKIGGWITA